jgi:hypothetical protein
MITQTLQSFREESSDGSRHAGIAVNFAHPMRIHAARDCAPTAFPQSAQERLLVASSSTSRMGLNLKIVSA